MFLERRIILKAEEQLSLNTHATRNLKDKSVIGESSKNARANQFKCQGNDHVVVVCPFRNLLVRIAGDDENKTVIYQPNGSAADSDDDAKISSI